MSASREQEGIRPIYTDADSSLECYSLEDAVVELKRRRKDKDLQKEVAHHLSTLSPELMSAFTQARAVCFRQLATPTHETLHFLKQAKRAKLAPLLWEYHSDKFVGSSNTYKRSLGKLPVYQYTGGDGRDMFEYRRIVDFDKCVGNQIGDAQCLSGEQLVDVHHELLEKIGRVTVKNICVDASPWFKKVGGHAHEYYPLFFALFIRDGILFENFGALPEEQNFLHDVVEPAYEYVKKTFGLSPLIVHLLPQEQESRPFWDLYPKKVEKYLPEFK